MAGASPGSSQIDVAPSKPYLPLAPDPAGFLVLSDQKHAREEEPSDSSVARRRKRQQSTTLLPTDLSEEDSLLVSLKESEDLSWKDIAERFQSHLGKTISVAALQMRYKRLREKFRVWTDADVRALQHAHGFWEKNAFQIVSAKVLRFLPTEGIRNVNAA